jgi:hypothetical protein
MSTSKEQEAMGYKEVESLNGYIVAKDADLANLLKSNGTSLLPVLLSCSKKKSDFLPLVMSPVYLQSLSSKTTMLNQRIFANEARCRAKQETCANLLSTINPIVIVHHRPACMAFVKATRLLNGLRLRSRCTGAGGGAAGGAWRAGPLSKRLRGGS